MFVSGMCMGTNWMEPSLLLSRGWRVWLICKFNQSLHIKCFMIKLLYFLVYYFFCSLWSCCWIYSGSVSLTKILFSQKFVLQQSSWLNTNWAISNRQFGYFVSIKYSGLFLVLLSLTNTYGCFCTGIFLIIRLVDPYLPPLVIWNIF